jgi:hypothetical protein
VDFYRLETLFASCGRDRDRLCVNAYPFNVGPVSYSPSLFTVESTQNLFGILFAL